jgi:hypothetical protein
MARRYRGTFILRQAQDEAAGGVWRQRIAATRNRNLMLSLSKHEAARSLGLNRSEGEG